MSRTNDPGQSERETIQSVVNVGIMRNEETANGGALD